MYNELIAIMEYVIKRLASYSDGSAISLMTPEPDNDETQHVTTTWCIWY